MELYGLNATVSVRSENFHLPKKTISPHGGTMNWWSSGYEARQSPVTATRWIDEVRDMKQGNLPSRH